MALINGYEMKAKEMLQVAEAQWTAVLGNRKEFGERYGANYLAVSGLGETVGHDANRGELMRWLEKVHGDHSRVSCLGGHIDVFGNKVIAFGTVDQIIENPLFSIRRARKAEVA